jgi:hypothetical protein
VVCVAHVPTGRHVRVADRLHLWSHPTPGYTEYVIMSMGPC